MPKQLCPRCGGATNKISGFIRCIECEYVLQSQNLDINWDMYDSDSGLTNKAKDADAQAKPYKSSNPKRRYPLDFS